MSSITMGGVPHSVTVEPTDIGCEELVGASLGGAETGDRERADKDEPPDEEDPMGLAAVSVSSGMFPNSTACLEECTKCYFRSLVI